MTWEFLVLGWVRAELWPTVTGFGERLWRTGPEMYWALDRAAAADRKTSSKGWRIYGLPQRISWQMAGEDKRPKCGTDAKSPKTA